MPLLEALFGPSVFDAYVPKPRHLFYAVLMLAVGNRAIFFDGWFWFGLVTFLLGTGLGISIMISIPVYMYSEYWTKADYSIRSLKGTIQILSKTNNPDIWEAFGLTAPMQEVEIIEQANIEYGIPRTTRFHRLPVSPAILQTIADIILSGQGNFSEDEIVNKRKLLPAPKFRELQDKMEGDGMLELRNKANPRQGYTTTPRGALVLYEAASPSVQQLVKGESNE